MTTTFWIVATLFCGVAILVLLVPIWRHRKRGGRWSLPGVVAAVVIAPVVIGADAAVAAGTTVTKDVPEGALAVERGETRIVAGWAKRLGRAEKQKRK